MTSFNSEIDRLSAELPDDSGVEFIAIHMTAILASTFASAHASESFSPSFPSKERVHQLMLYTYQFMRDDRLVDSERFSDDSRSGIVSLINKFQDETELSPTVIIENWSKIEDPMPTYEGY